MSDSYMNIPNYRRWLLPPSLPILGRLPYVSEQMQHHRPHCICSSFCSYRPFHRLSEYSSSSPYLHGREGYIGRYPHRFDYGSSMRTSIPTIPRGKGQISFFQKFIISMKKRGYEYVKPLNSQITPSYQRTCEAYTAGENSSLIFTVCVKFVPLHHFKLAYVVLHIAVKQFFETHF